MSELPIIQYWHSEDVPEEVERTVASFRRLNPTLPHLLFHERSAEKFIADRFSQREAAAFRACAVPAMQADYLRYCALLALGGFWIDVDFACVRPLSTLAEPRDSGVMFRPKEIDVPANNCFLAFTTPGHPLPRLLLDVSTANVERRNTESVAFITGPWVLMILGLVFRSGSFDAVQQELTDERLARLAYEVQGIVGDADRVVEAFDGVKIISGKRLDEWIRNVGQCLAYKESDDHWVNWQARGRSPFRAPGR